MIYGYDSYDAYFCMTEPVEVDDLVEFLIHHEIWKEVLFSECL